MNNHSDEMFCHPSSYVCPLSASTRSSCSFKEAMSFLEGEHQLEGLRKAMGTPRRVERSTLGPKKGKKERGFNGLGPKLSTEEEDKKAFSRVWIAL